MLQSLEARWKWAKQEGNNFRDGCWIGYGIERLMSKNSWIGSHGGSEKYDRPTLNMIIEGREDDQTLREAAQLALTNWENSKDKNEKVLKEVAILFYFKDGSANFENSTNLKISNLDLWVNLKNQPLIWLGKTGQNESINFLKNNYKNTKSQDVKEDLIVAVSLHKESPEVFAFLKNIVKNEKNEDLREDAVFWLGQQDNDEVLDFLVDTAHNDRSMDVREQAVFAISQVETDEAVDVLIGLAKKAEDNDIQEKAIFWLGQKAADKSADVLEDVAYDEDEVEIQKQAVFALSQLSEGKGVSSLIKIAKDHPNGEIRKKAIFWLGQTNDPRALDVIVSILKNK